MPSPILITVDDDPEVSRSLARDLRQQYGEDYRIRRAESGAAALDALKELKLRDERVGLLLSDYRMPGMTGVEFLEQARQFYPKARRVLLTAYADTEAAIAAINRADVHQQIAELPNVRVRTCSEVVGASGGDHLERLRIADRVAGTEEEVEASWLFVFIGAAPGTEWLGKEMLRDENGFVVTGPDLVIDGQLPADWPLERQPYFLETSVPGVFAAGDVRGQSVKRVASAVGEGAMAVTLVHRYLELL